MANNSSLVDGGYLLYPINDRVIIVLVLVMFFLVINFVLLITFFKNECFGTATRYVLFAVTLLSDSLILFLTNLLLFLTYFHVNVQVWLCIIVSAVILLYFTVTPVTLTAMTLECYVAICMPLRHGELCSTHNTVHSILIIHGISSITCIVILTMFFASASPGLYVEYTICSVEVFILYRWQDHIRLSIRQLYFFVMFIIIVFCYVKIMKAAKAASGENKKLKMKGLRTVVLHGFQLLLCLISLWCPLIESVALQISFKLYMDIRYYNYILFSIAPRCLSPLIYGLRDEKFFHALKFEVQDNLFPS
uniref:G-protein coupled receptors family 1 profile domain-containing protein n=1 Tax=Anabas testudineus TaxID=64144 RepID=A0A3Q1IJM9_ANATE